MGNSVGKGQSIHASEGYEFDPGKVLTAEERAEVAKTVTPIHLIQSRTCKRETNNDHYRLGRR